MQQVNLYPLVRSIASFVLPDKLMKRPGSGGSFSSKYCYTVWLRHLVHLSKAGLLKSPCEIKKIAEIGPGDSLGVGIAGLLTGVQEYYAFDVIEHANREKNIQVLAELANYFIERIDLPHKEHEFRNTHPKLEDYSYPAYIFDGTDILDEIKKRETDIKKALMMESSAVKIEYVPQWYEAESDLQGELDLIYSQAVMEHVDDIRHAYTKMYEWLKPGGIISHQIDFKTHEMTKEWNGHWYIGEATWKFLLHGRKYSINRLPFSAHIAEMEKAGFVIKNILPFHMKNTFDGQAPKVPNVPFSKDDMTTASALIQAIKPT
jgi:hypothetical protein